MRHRNKRLQLNRFTSWRKSTLRSMVRNLLIYQRINTTLHKARATVPLLEKVIGLAKENTLNAKRRAFQILNSHQLVSQLFNEIGPRFAKRKSGFTRIIRLAQRRGDNAQVVIFELTEIKEKEVKKHKKEKETKAQEMIEEKTETAKEKPAAEKKPETQAAVKEKPPITKKPTKKFLGGLRNIFKKERDSL